MIVGGGRVVTPKGVADGGRVMIEDGRIASIGSGSGPLDVDAGGGWIAPGFVDVQINGAHGIDVTTEPHRIAELGRTLVPYGVTAFVPTVITCAEPARRAALAAWASLGPPAGGAVPLGLHLEGPMLSPARKGAHPADLLTVPDLALVAGWSPDAGVVMATVAPELPGALDVIGELARRGIVVSIGHTDGSAADFVAARAAGARYVTHLFNAMRPFSHRDPGPVGAALADDAVVVGLICDGIHVDPVTVRMAYRALGPARLNLVTDAISALGVEAGRLGSVDVTVGEDGVRNADGILAGSTLSLDQAVRNLVEFTGCDVADAVATVTSVPADLLDRPERGRLIAGARADVTVLDPGLGVLATIVGGEVAWRS